MIQTFLFMRGLIIGIFPHRVWLILSVLIWVSIGAPLSAQKSAFTPVDKGLLREDWIKEEARRSRGLLYRLSRLLESPRGKMNVKDAAGRKFQMDASGTVSFNPRDDNWFPVIPRTSQAGLHLAEANGLYKLGLKSLALGLYKANRAMSAFLPEGGAQIRRSAVEATRNINRMRNTEENFPYLNYKADPVVFLDDARNRLHLLSDRHHWRLHFPGLWRYMRAKSDESVERRKAVIPEISYLKQKGFIITVAAELWPNAYRIPGLKPYMIVWDTRRSLSSQRRRILGFKRAISSLDGEFCGTPQVALRFQATARRSYERLRKEQAKIAFDKRTCVILESAFSARGVPYRFLEFYYIRPLNGFYLELRYKVGQEAAARKMLRSILETLKFSAH